MVENVEDTEQGGGETAGFLNFSKSVIESVFLFNAESLVITPHIVRYLSGFQFHVKKKLIGRFPWQSLNGR